MIIQEHGDHLILIRQTDHAVLSGYFARELGHEGFARPEPLESFQLAATEHDNGWNEWELQPRIDPVSFLPYSFMSLPTQEHIDLYQRGIERIVKVDRYAGLLVSLHCVDRLSLYFCLGPLEGATIDAVPADYQGTEVDWDLQPDGINGARLEPYPFRRDPLEISILARRIPKRRYADDLDLQKVLAQAPYFGQKFTLRAGDTRMNARVAIGV